MTSAVGRSPGSILDCWHVVGRLPATGQRALKRVVLLGREVEYGIDSDGAPVAFRLDSSSAGQKRERRLPVSARLGFLWTHFADAPQPLFDIPEYDEPDRKILLGDPLGVQISAPRAIENFLDVAHFPFVHTGILGETTHTEVPSYDVYVNAEGELRVENVRALQPKATANAAGAADMAYAYRIPHPCCCFLYKRPARDVRWDVIGLLIRPISEEQIAVHSFNCILDSQNDTSSIRAFQQTIFGQDKPILENQIPKRLPLDVHTETSIKADRASVMFRRWLKDRGMTYGTVAHRPPTAHGASNQGRAASENAL